MKSNSSNSSSNTSNTGTNTEIINAIKDAARAARAARTGAKEPARGYQRRAGKYLAQIGVGNNKIYLGTFDTAEAATAAYNRAKAQLQSLRATSTVTNTAATPL